MSHTIVPDNRGRLLLPKDLRDRLGLSDGGAVVADVTDTGAIILRDARLELAEKLAALEGVASQAPGSVEDLIAERRRQAEHDLA